MIAYEIGTIFVSLGDPDRAFTWLARAVAERSAWIVYARRDPRIDALQEDPRFQELFHRR